MNDNEYSSGDELDRERDHYDDVQADSDDDRQKKRKQLMQQRQQRLAQKQQQPMQADGDDEGESEDLDATRMQDGEEDEEEEEEEETEAGADADELIMDKFRATVLNLSTAVGGYEDVQMEDGSWKEIYVPGDDVLGEASPFS